MTLDLRTRAVETRPRGGLDPLRARWAWWRARERRARLHTRPFLRPTFGGRVRLPGLAVDTELYEAADPYQRPLGLVLVASTGHVSVTLGLTRPRLDPAWVATLGAWFARLDAEPDLAACAVVVRPLAGRVQVLVQPTWVTTGPEGRRDPAALAIEVGARVPRLVLTLARDGIGTAKPLSAGHLALLVREAYRPRAADARSTAGQGRRQPWAHVGPDAWVERWQHLEHAGAASSTCLLSRVPPDVVLANLVTLAHRSAERVTLRFTADDASLSSLVTVTARGGPAELADAVQALQGVLPAPLRPWLRPLHGNHAAGFAAGLPTGTLLGTHAAPPGLVAGLVGGRGAGTHAGTGAGTD